MFNSPFANSRSVAELVIGEVIMLARQLGDRSNELHNGTWNKVSAKCWEIRGKTLGKYTIAEPRKGLINPAKALLAMDILARNFRFLPSQWA